MKKSYYFVFIAFFFFSYDLFAGCPTPLSWDFPGVPYIGENSRTIPLSLNPLCILHYKYCYRTTPLFCDFAITEVSLEGDCEQFKNIDTLIKYASRDLIANENPWQKEEIPECPKYTRFYYRQSTAACFTDFYWDPVTLQWTSIPCDADGLER